jgi:hypothetical protein
MTISYELALKLKNAGFPHDAECTMCALDDSSTHIPGLSQLIAACGEGFEKLTNEARFFGKPWWFAFSSGGEFFKDGPTPEEAVANLWLALNSSR